MLIFFVFVKLLSLMTNTRVRFADCKILEADRCYNARPCQQSTAGVRHLYRKYAGCGGIILVQKPIV
jgi:hypothetical protein